MNTPSHLSRTLRHSSFVADVFAEIEFELALDLCDAEGSSLGSAVAKAAASMGGEALFAVPAGTDLEGIAEVAAARLPDAGKGSTTIVFAVKEAGERGLVRLSSREEVGEKVYGFARAFAGILDRLGRRDAAPSPADA